MSRIIRPNIFAALMPGTRPLLGGGGASQALVKAVRFDGATVWLEKAAEPTGITDGPNFTKSLGVRFEAGDGVAQTLLCVGTFSTLESDLGFLIERTTANLIRAVGYTAAGVKIFDCITTGNTITADGVAHSIQVEFNDTVCTIKFDGTSVGTNTPGTSGSVDLTGKWQIGRHDDAANRNYLNASVADIWGNDTSITDSEEFWDATNSLFRPLGANGENPLDATPPLFLSGAASSFHINKGSGGDFTLNGPLDDAATFGVYAEAYVPANKGTLFNGTTQYMNGVTPSGLNNGLVTFCCAFKPKLDSTSDKLFQTNNQRAFVTVEADNLLDIIFRDTVGTNALVDTNVGGMTADEWAILLVSADVSTGSPVASMWLASGGVETELTPAILTGPLTLDHDREWFVGREWNVSSGFFGGEIAYLLYGNADADFSVEANRRKYMNADFTINAANLGADGSGIGFTPHIFLPNPFGTFEENAGSLGDFTVNNGPLADGTVVDAS